MHWWSVVDPLTRPLEGRGGRLQGVEVRSGNGSIAGPAREHQLRLWTPGP